MENVLKVVTEQVEILKELLKVDAVVEVKVDEEGGDEKDSLKGISIIFTGSDLGYMIGNRGRHLRSLQSVASMIINKELEAQNLERVYLNMDVSGYMKERAERLEQDALRYADDARILGEPVEMEPMSAADRRIVHMALKKFDDIKTESEGEGRERYVKIIPVK